MQYIIGHTAVSVTMASVVVLHYRMRLVDDLGNVNVYSGIGGMLPLL